MNIELLIKLTNQAVEKYITLDPANAIPPYHIKYNRILAELIVRECAKSLWTEECHNSDLALEEFKRNSAKIKEHFGVEE